MYIDKNKRPMERDTERERERDMGETKIKIVSNTIDHIYT